MFRFILHKVFFAKTLIIHYLTFKISGKSANYIQRLTDVGIRHNSVGTNETHFTQAPFNMINNIAQRAVLIQLNI